MQNIINFQYFLSTHPTLFILLIVWSIVWKGFALWKAGKNKSFIWFIVLLLANTLGLLEIIYIFAIKNKEIETDTSTGSTSSPSSSATTSSVKTEVKTDTKVETVVEEKKEEISAPAPEVKIEEAPVMEVKPEEINHEEIKAETTVPEEVKQEINQ